MPTSLPVLKIVPYGIANFEEIRTEDYAYVDKTRFIEALESAKLKYPFIIRPRRFGKTLFSSTLTAYYDKAAASKFDETFSGTYIGSHKTALASRLYVLKFDFSGISSGEKLLESFLLSIRERIEAFFVRYPFTGYETFLSRSPAITEPNDLLLSFFAFIRPTVRKNLLVIIDEYDQFANDLLSSDPALFKAITEKDGFLKKFYTQLKRATDDDGVIAKIYITGVTSIALDSMSSGFSIAQNISSDSRFSDLFGFTEEELRSLIPDIIDLTAFGHSVDDLINRMRELYNGYRFSPFSEKTVFNASMCLYYLDFLQKNNQEPERYMDPAVNQDPAKILGILRLGRHEDIVDVVTKAIRREPINFSDRPELLRIELNNEFNKDCLLSALVYLGFLTYAPGKAHRLIVPNRVMMQLFVDVYFTYLRRYEAWKSTTAADFHTAVAALVKGDPSVLVNRIAEILAGSCGTRSYLTVEEKDFHWALLVGANFAPGYDVFVEHEVCGIDKGFIDLLMVSKSLAPSYLFEVKYLKKSSTTPVAVKTKLNEAIKQANGYAAGVNIRHIPHLKKVAVVFGGFEVKAVKVWD